MKLTDFGLSTNNNFDTMAKYGKKPPLKLHKTPFVLKILGTADYMAPEILNTKRVKETDEMVDWWAVGVIAFEFILGGLPFNAKSKEEVFDNIKSHRIKWPDESILAQINPLLIDLIKQFMNPDPSKRLGVTGAKEVMAHPFFKDIDWTNTKSM